MTAALLGRGTRLLDVGCGFGYWKHIASILFAGRFPRTSEDTCAYDGGHLHYCTFADVEGLMARAGFTGFRREPVLDRAKCERAARLVGGHVLREF